MTRLLLHEYERPPVAAVLALVLAPLVLSVVGTGLFLLALAFLVPPVVWTVCAWSAWWGMQCH